MSEFRPFFDEQKIPTNLIGLIKQVLNSFANPCNQCVRVAKHIKAQYKNINLTHTLQDE